MKIKNLILAGALALAGAIIGAPAVLAQSQFSGGAGTVATTGTVTSGHCVTFVDAAHIQDSGGTCGGSGSPCVVTGGSLQFNNAGAFGCATNFTFSGVTLTVSASGVLDLHAGTSTANFLLPGAFPTGFVRVTTTTGAVSSAELSGDATTSGSAAVTVSNGSHITNASIPNSGLVNTATTVNGQTCTLGSPCTVPEQVNGGNLTSQAGLNFITSTTNGVGLTVTPSNPGTNQVKYEVTGGSYTGNAATATALAALPTPCATGSLPTGILANGNSTGCQVKIWKDIRDYYDSTGAAHTADFGLAISNAYAAIGSGIALDYSGLCSGVATPITVYGNTDPYAAQSINFSAYNRIKCNLIWVTSVSIHMPYFANEWEGPPSGGTGAGANGAQGFDIEPCVAAAGCGPNLYPQFPFSLTTPTAGTAACVGPPGPACTAYTTGTATITTSSTAITGSGTTWDSTMVGGWIYSGTGTTTHTNQCVMYIQSVNSTTSITTANVPNPNCTIEAGSGVAGAYTILKPNANILWWNGGGGNNNSLNNNCFNHRIEQIRIDLEGLPSGIGMYSTNCQENYDLISVNFSLNAGHQGASNHGFNDANPAALPPLAAIMNDSYYMGNTGTGTFGSIHNTILDATIGMNQNNTCGNGNSYGYVGQNWSYFKGASDQSGNVIKFSTINAASSCKFTDNVYLDGTQGGIYEIGHMEWAGTNFVHLGANNSTFVNLTVGTIANAGTNVGILFDTNANLYNKVPYICTVSNGVTLLKEIVNTTAFNGAATFSSTTARCTDYEQGPTFLGNLKLSSPIVWNGNTGLGPDTTGGAGFLDVGNGTANSTSGTVQATTFAAVGTNGGISQPEGTGANISPGPGAGKDTLYADSTNHCWHANLNGADVGCLSSAVGSAQTNSTPVTVSNPTAATDTIMMAISLPANYLNFVGQPFHITAAGVLTTTAASSPQVTFTPKICSVAGCGSGTVTPLAAIQSSTLNATAIANATWKEDLDLIVVANGASCNFIVKGALAIDLGSAVAATPDTIFVDTNTAASSPNQNCANALFLDFFVQQSTTGASNSYKQLLGIIR